MDGRPARLRLARAAVAPGAAVGAAQSHGGHGRGGRDRCRRDRTGGRPGGAGSTQFRPAGQEPPARDSQYAYRSCLCRPGRRESAGPGALRPGDGGDPDFPHRGQRGRPPQAERAGGAADQAVARAREFYRKLEAQLRGQTGHRALAALGAAYDEIGRLSDKIGSKEEGLEDLRRGLALRERLAGDDPQPGARADLGRTLRAIGSMLAQAGHHAEAIETYGRARAIFAELAREGPVAGFGRDLARCDRDIGYTHYLSGKPAEALPALERASAALEALPPAERATPENRAELARTLNSICLVLRQTGRTSEVITTYRRLIEILQGVIQSDPTTEYLADLAIYQVNLGQLYRQLGRRAEALEIYRSAASTRERIAKEYPGITSFQVQLANVYNSLGNVLEELNRPEESIPAMERAAEIYEPLVKANPTATQVATNQATILRNLGLFQAQAGRLEQARTSYERSMTISRKLASDHPKVPQFQSNYAFAAFGLGELRESSGDRAALSNSSARRTESSTESPVRGPMTSSKWPAYMPGSASCSSRSQASGTPSRRTRLGALRRRRQPDPPVNRRRLSELSRTQDSQGPGPPARGPTSGSS